MPLAAIAAGVLLLRNKQGVSGIGAGETLKTSGKIIMLYNKRHDVNGNPNYGIIFQEWDGRILRGRTPSSSSFGYKLGDYWVNREVNIWYRKTPSGKIVFTGIEEV